MGRLNEDGGRKMEEWRMEVVALNNRNLSTPYTENPVQLIFTVKIELKVFQKTKVLIL